MSGWNIKDVTVAGKASPEAQVEYLRKCLQIAYDKIATLELQLDTLRLQREHENSMYAKDLSHLELSFDRRVREQVAALVCPAPKRPWWAFWRKREARDQVQSW